MRNVVAPGSILFPGSSSTGSRAGRNKGCHQWFLFLLEDSISTFCIRAKVSLQVG